MMVESGYRTGAFFSPYVVDPRERIQFGRGLISKEDFVAVLEKLIPIAESMEGTEFGGVTEFELKTAMGFEFWKQKNCDWVALEVGLGGRLDATNIVSPAASIITSISLDHTSILGKTEAEIAFEKAGIIKPGVPVMVGAIGIEAMDVIRQEAEKNGSPMYALGAEILVVPQASGFYVSTPWSNQQLDSGLFGRIQGNNLALAYAAMEAAKATGSGIGMQRGAKLVQIPGRFERKRYEGKQVVLDGAHNNESAKVLGEMLKEAGLSRAACIMGMLHGHEPSEFAYCLGDTVTEFFTVPIDFHRSRTANDVAKSLGSSGVKATPMKSIRAALRAALQSAESDLILVTGSYYLVGEVMRLGLLQPLEESDRA
jgi:dihydrofolate synthase/folylpolyglutamate synthase